MFLIWSENVGEQLKSFKSLLNLSNLALSNCFKHMRNVVQRVLKWFFLSEKLQKLPSSKELCLQVPRVVTCSPAHNFHSKQLLKSLIQCFSINNIATKLNYTAQPCLTIIACIFINGWKKLTTIGCWLHFEKLLGVPLRPWLKCIIKVIFYKKYTKNISQTSFLTSFFYN